MNKNKRTLFFIAISLLIATMSNAQINFKEKQNTNEKNVLKNLTECNSNFQFKFISQYGDDLKFEHKKFAIFYSGIEVVGMDFVIHEKKQFDTVFEWNI